LNYILTGAPGCGKTSLIRALEMQGHLVVEEAATDVISHGQSLGITKPWLETGFIDQILYLQNQRRLNSLHNYNVIFDRSPICTYALCQFLNLEPSEELLKVILEMKNYTAVFIQNLGFVDQTNARTISFEEALSFEKLHREAYKKFGYILLEVPPLPLTERLDYLLKLIRGQ
jgi:predicted ATPase